MNARFAILLAVLVLLQILSLVGIYIVFRTVKTDVKPVAVQAVAVPTVEPTASPSATLAPTAAVKVFRPVVTVVPTK